MIWSDVLRSQSGEVEWSSCARSTCAPSFNFGCLVGARTIDNGNRKFKQESIKIISLLTTCKQIYAEANHLVWKVNTMVVNLSDYYYFRIDHVRRRTLLWQQHHIKFNVQAFQHDIESKVLVETANMLSRSEASSLKTITICPAVGLQRIINLGARNKMDDNVIKQHIKALSQMKACFYKTEVLLKIVLPIGWNSLSNSCQVHFRKSPLKELRTQFGSRWPTLDVDVDVAIFEPVDNLLEKMHSALGGELWQDDILCYKDGKELCQPFKLRPGAEEEVEALDSKLLNDAIKRRAIHYCWISSSLPPEMSRLSRMSPDALRNVDVSEIKLPPNIYVDTLVGGRRDGP